jgi:hypothetical protein
MHIFSAFAWHWSDFKGRKKRSRSDAGYMDLLKGYRSNYCASLIWTKKLTKIDEMYNEAEVRFAPSRWKEASSDAG